MKYNFPCGCSFDKFDPYNPPDCPEAWRIICEGKTKGLFQIESYLCKHWSKKVKPDNIELLSALIALVRPGVLKAKDESGKTMAELFVERRDGAEYEPIDENIKDILSTTYGVMLYQEQTIAIAKVLAGFNLAQADELRKGIGKKKADLIALCRTQFIDGCANTKLVDNHKANYIFDIIEKSNRYSFNLAHSISYGFTSYITAYLKSHFPLEFFTSWIKFAKNDQDFQQEIRELVNDARIFGIEVKPPKLLDKQKDAYNKNGSIYFGLSDIKGVGEKAIDKLLPKIPNKPTFTDLIKITPHSLMEKFIKAGSLDEFGHRTKLLHILGIYHQLSPSEQTQFSKAKDITDLVELNSTLKKGGGLCASTKRKNFVDSLVLTLNKPPRALKDTPIVIAEYEKEMLGINLTASKIEMSNLAYQADTECIEFLQDKVDRGVFAIEINEMDIRKVKTGQNKGREMCTLSGGDITGVIENMVCFANEYDKYSNVIIRGNTVLVKGERSKDRRQLIIREVWQA